MLVVILLLDFKEISSSRSVGCSRQCVDMVVVECRRRQVEWKRRVLAG